MKEQKEHPQRHNLVSHFLIRLLSLRMHTSCLEADKLVQEGEKADVEDRELLRMHLELIMLIQAVNCADN